jgi:hypothetical protein
MTDCFICFREQNSADNSNERYGNLSRAGCRNTLPYDSSSSGGLTALQQSHYGSFSSLTQQSSQNCTNQQQLHFVSNGNTGQSGNALAPQQPSHYGSSRNIATAQYTSPVQPQHSYSRSVVHQNSRYSSTRNVSLTTSQQSSPVTSPSIMQQGKRNIHNTFPGTSSTLLPQNETEVLVKEIAMLNINEVWKQRSSKAVPGESLNYEPTASSSSSSSLTLVPHSSNASGSVTSVSRQQIHPFVENSLMSVSAGFSGVSNVCSDSQSAAGTKSTAVQETRTSGVSTEKHFTPSSASLCSQFQQRGMSPGQ